MKYFVARGEDRHLDVASRSELRGAFVALSNGVTHYELKGPTDGELVVLVGGLTVPLFYWDMVPLERSNDMPIILLHYLIEINTGVRRDRQEYHRCSDHRRWTDRHYARN